MHETEYIDITVKNDNDAAFNVMVYSFLVIRLHNQIYQYCHYYLHVQYIYILQIQYYTSTLHIAHSAIKKIQSDIIFLLLLLNFSSKIYI